MKLFTENYLDYIKDNKYIHIQGEILGLQVTMQSIDECLKVTKLTFNCCYLIIFIN